jgi:hypothetical protein
MRYISGFNQRISTALGESEHSMTVPMNTQVWGEYWEWVEIRMREIRGFQKRTDKESIEKEK